MTLHMAVFLGLFAAALLAAASGARAQERAVIFVSVDEDGRTIVRCEGAECETVDCSGNSQLMAADNSYVIHEEETDSCVTRRASAEDADFLDLAQQETADLLLAGPVPGGGGGGGGLGEGFNTDFIGSDEANQRRVQDLGEGLEESPIEL